MSAGRFSPLAAALKVSGVSRMGDNDKAILVSFSRPLTDAELRFFHEVCERSAPLMLLGSKEGTGFNDAT